MDWLSSYKGITGSNFDRPSADDVKLQALEQGIFSDHKLFSAKWRKSMRINDSRTSAHTGHNIARPTYNLAAVGAYATAIAIARVRSTNRHSSKQTGTKLKQLKLKRGYIEDQRKKLL